MSQYILQDSGKKKKTWLGDNSLETRVRKVGGGGLMKCENENDSTPTKPSNCHKKMLLKYGDFGHTSKDRFGHNQMETKDLILTYSSCSITETESYDSSVDQSDDKNQNQQTSQ